MDREYSILFALLAVQLGKVSPADLIDAALAHGVGNEGSLGDALVDAGLLSTRDRDLIVAFARQAVQAHDGDSVATVASFGGEEFLRRACHEEISFTETGGIVRDAGRPAAREALDRDVSATAREIPGRYRDQGELTRGGVGRVLLAYDEHLDREVALKVLLPEDGINGSGRPFSHALPKVTRFLREARITGQLEHPSIVPVHELGRRADGTPYYTMKLVRGRTLQQALSEAENLEGRLRLLPHIVDMCQAIAYAHSRGVLHRDLKPSNVMVGEFGETVIIDWGLAKARGRKEEATLPDGPVAPAPDTDLDEAVLTLTREGQSLGTPHYMPPEQARGQLQRVDERSDVYALGATLYALLTGRPPYQGQDAADIMARVIREEPEAVLSLVPQAPAELAAICAKAMARAPEDRYACAGELAEELQRFLSGALVGAYHYSSSERLCRFARRHRNALGALGLAGAAVLVVAAYAHLQVLDERDAAVAARDRALQEEYYRTISLAAFKLPLGKAADVAAMLESSPDGLRGWEWGYYRNQCYPEELSLKVGEGLVRLAASADGRMLAGLTRKGTLAVWDTRTWEQRWERVAGLRLTDIAFHPTEPILVATGTGVFALDANTGETLHKDEGLRPLYRYEDYQDAQVFVDWVAVTEAPEYTPGEATDGVVWTFETDAEGWLPRGPGGSLRHEPGRLCLAYEETDPFDPHISSDELAEGLPAEQFQEFAMAVHAEGLPPGTHEGGVFFFNESGEWGRAAYRFQNGDNEVRLNLRQSALPTAAPYTGTMVQYRLDLPDNPPATAGAPVFSPDGKALYFPDGEYVVARDTTSWTETYRLTGGRRVEFVERLALLPDGNLVLCGGGSDRTTQLEAVSLPGGESLWYIDTPSFLNRRSTPQALGVVGEGAGLLTLHASHARYWSLEKGRPELTSSTKPPPEQTRSRTSLAIHPDGQTYVVGDTSGSIFRFEVQTGGPAGVIHTTTGVQSLLWTDHGQRLVTGDKNGTIRVFDESQFYLAQDEEAFRTAHLVCNMSVSFSSDSRYLVTSGYDIGYVGVMDLETGESLKVPYLEDCCEKWVAFQPGTHRLAMPARQSVHFWDVDRQAFVKELPVDGAVCRGSFNGDGDRLLVAYQGNTARQGMALFDPATGSPIRDDFLPENEAVICAISLDGSRVAAISRTHPKAWVWCPPEATIPLRLELPDRAIEGTPIAFHPDGSMLAFGYENGRVGFWDTDTGGCLDEWVAGDGKILALAFNPEGDRLVSTAEGYIIRLWDWQAGVELTSFRNKSYSALDAEFSPDGSMLAYTDANTPSPPVHIRFSGSEGKRRRDAWRQYRRDKATCLRCLQDLEQAKFRWHLEHALVTGPVPGLEQLRTEAPETIGACPAGGAHTPGLLGELPSCSIHGAILPMEIGFAEVLGQWKQANPQAVTAFIGRLSESSAADAMYLNNLAWAWITEGRAYYEEALPLARRAVSLVEGDPENRAVFLDTLAYAELKLGQLPSAMAHFEQAIDLGCNESQAGLALARLLSGSPGDVEETFRFLEQGDPVAFTDAYFEDLTALLEIPLPDETPEAATRRTLALERMLTTRKALRPTNPEQE